MVHVALVAAMVAVAPSLAEAGGMFLPARGARPLGRAGAFIAGADDGSALYYNPAGLSDIPGISVLADAGLILQNVHYARIDSGGNPQRPVDGSQDLLPIPTLVVTYKPAALERVTFGLGIWAPYIGQNSYPDNGPQRYSLISLKGSALAVLEFAAAVHLTDDLSLGAGFENMIVQFRNRSVLSACTQLNCAPEDPGFDSLSETNTSALFTPSGIVGLTYARPTFRVGAALQLPFFVRADGTVHARLPTDPFFQNAMVVGDQASLAFDLPLELRLGVEWRPTPRFRTELAGDYQSWSMQDNITITPHNVKITGVPGVGTYTLHPLQVNRRLVDSFSARLGGEWAPLAWLIVRAGYLFETSATPDSTLSVLSPDGQHHLIAVGLGLRLGPVRVDAGYAHVFTLDRSVANSQANQINPIEPSLAVGVGRGSYQISDDVISLGLEARF